MSLQAWQRWRRIMKRRQERKKLLEEAERRRIRRMERMYGVKSSTLPEARVLPVAFRHRRRVLTLNPNHKPNTFRGALPCCSRAAKGVRASSCRTCCTALWDAGVP